MGCGGCIGEVLPVFVRAREAQKNRSLNVLWINGFCMIISLILIALMTAVRCQTPVFDDVFHQREEIRRIAIPCLVSLVVIAAMVIVRALRLFPSDEAHDIMQMFIIFQWAALCAW